MLLVALYVVSILTFAAECISSNDVEAKNEVTQPRRIPFGFPIPFYTGYYEHRSKPFRNPYETKQEEEFENRSSMLITDLERDSQGFDLNFFKKIFKDEAPNDKKSENLKDAERLLADKIEESKGTNPSNLLNPLSIWNKNVLRNVKVPLNTNSKETQTDVESAIVFRDDDYVMKVNEDKQNIAQENRLANVPAQSHNHLIQNKNNTKIIKNKDYFTVPVTMPSNTISYPTTRLSDNANYADENALTVQNIQTLPAAPALHLTRNIQLTNNLAQGVQTPQALPIQYFGVEPQNQGLTYAVNSAPNNGNGLNNQANSMFTVLNIPNTAVHGINGNSQAIVYYLLNQGNGANIPSAYQLVSFPKNNIVSGEGSNMVPNNEPMELPKLQTNVVGSSNQPNYIMFLNNPSNNNQATNLFPLNNQQNLVTFPNQPNILFNNQLNAQATNSMPLNNQANFVSVQNQLNLPPNTQLNVPATKAMPQSNHANLVPVRNQPNILISSHQPNVVTMTSLPNNMVAFTNQPAVTFNSPFPNQTNLQNSMIIQPNNANMPNLPINQNQPNNIVALLNQLNNKDGNYQPPTQSNILAALDNNQAGLAFMTNQGNNIGIPENQSPNMYGNIVAVLANQPAALNGNLATEPSKSGTMATNTQLSIVQVVPNVSNEAENRPSLIDNGHGNQGKEFKLMDTRDEVEQLFKDYSEKMN